MNGTIETLERPLDVAEFYKTRWTGVVVGFQNPVQGALVLMRRAEYHAAAQVLAAEFKRYPSKVELARIANLIEPCGMITEAIEGLKRLAGSLDQRDAGPDLNSEGAQAFGGHLSPALSPKGGEGAGGVWA